MTEKEIRDSAYERFAEELSKHYPHTWSTLRTIDKVLNQLKEETESENGKETN